MLKDKIIGEKWGKETVSYINDLLTDLQTTRRKRSSTMSRALDRMRGNYAGAILTVNPGVRHHGGGTALREEFLGQAAGRGGSRDTPARRRLAAIPPARHQAGRDELHRRAQKPCGQSVGSHACCDRLRAAKPTGKP